MYVFLKGIRKWLPKKQIKSVIEPGKYFQGVEEREIGIKWHQGIIWISLWKDQQSWNSDDPWWWSFSINVADLIFGKEKLISQEYKSGRTEINFDVEDQNQSGVIPATYVNSLRVFKRPRWYKKRISQGFEIKLSEPIKGVKETKGVYSNLDSAVEHLIEYVKEE